jgi:ribosomal protein S18 acetylase RimI-like enzyme
MNTAKRLLLNEKYPVYIITTTAEFSNHNVRDFLKQVEAHYPNFRSWLDFTFARQLTDGNRKALIVKDKNEIVGVSLLKKTREENKICTFYVAPQHRGKGIGKMLMEESLSYLESEAHITVCEERWAEMRPFLEKYSFKLDIELPNFYRDDRTEYFCSR